MLEPAQKCENNDMPFLCKSVLSNCPFIAFKNGLLLFEVFWGLNHKFHSKTFSIAMKKISVVPEAKMFPKSTNKVQQGFKF